MPSSSPSFFIPRRLPLSIPVDSWLTQVLASPFLPTPKASYPLLPIPHQHLTIDRAIARPESLIKTHALGRHPDPCPIIRRTTVMSQLGITSETLSQLLSELGEDAPPRSYAAAFTRKMIVHLASNLPYPPLPRISRVTYRSDPAPDPSHLRSLSQALTGVKPMGAYITQNLSIAIPLPPVTLNSSSISFGPFAILINPNHLLFNRDDLSFPNVYCPVLYHNYYDSDEGIHTSDPVDEYESAHPHLSRRARARHMICLGEAAAGVRDALLSFDLVVVALLYKAVLSNYNADSPYQALEFYQPGDDDPPRDPECADCGGTIRPRDRNRGYTNPDGESICLNCTDNYSTCDYCAEIVPNDDVTSLNNSSRYYCSSCTEHDTFCCDSCSENFTLDLQRCRGDSSYCRQCFDDLPPDDDESESDTPDPTPTPDTDDPEPAPPSSQPAVFVPANTICTLGVRRTIQDQRLLGEYYTFLPSAAFLTSHDLFTTFPPSVTLTVDGDRHVTFSGTVGALREVVAILRANPSWSSRLSFPEFVAVAPLTAANALIPLE